MEWIDDAFDSRRAQVLAKLAPTADKSPKGSVDAPIVDLICAINELPDYVTTSSCSGRVALYTGTTEDAKEGDDEPADVIVPDKGYGSWLLASHAPVTLEQVAAALESCSGTVALKVEPFILHVMCRSIAAARQLMQVALAAGFRESGIVLGKKVMVAVRTTSNMIEVPLLINGRPLLTPDALRVLIDVANDKFQRNAAKTQGFFDALCRMVINPPSAAAAETASTSAAHVAFTRADTVGARDALHRWGHVAGILHDRIVVFGGYGRSGKEQRLADVLCGCPRTHAWTSVPTVTEAPSPRPRVRAAADVLPTTATMFIFGGRESPVKPLGDSWLLQLQEPEGKGDNPADDRAAGGVGGNAPCAAFLPLASTGDMLARWAHSVTAVSATQVLVAFGRSADAVLDDVAVGTVDAVSQTVCWSRVACTGTAPCGRFGHAATAVGPKQVLVHGGFTAAALGMDDPSVDSPTVTREMVVADLHVLHWRTDGPSSWSQPRTRGAPLPGLASHCAVALGSGVIALVGGVSDRAATTLAVLASADGFSECVVHDISSSVRWPDDDAIVPVRHACIVCQDQLFCIGGGAACVAFGSYFCGAYVAAVRDILQCVPSAPADTAPLAAVNAVVVARSKVKTAKTYFEDQQLINKARRIESRTPPQVTGGEPEFVIPLQPAGVAALRSVTSPHHMWFVQNMQHQPQLVQITTGEEKLSPLKVLRGNLEALLKQVGGDVSVLDTIPKKFEWVGDILVAPQDSFQDARWSVIEPELWKAIAAAFNAQRVALAARIHHGGTRASQTRLKHGDSGVVCVRENGLVYQFDITKTMFSSGNVTEKARMGRQPAAGETVVDLFCGIGYFTIPLLVHAKAAFVYACDWNPDAVAAITNNLVLNGVADKCKVFQGDNRMMADIAHNAADRVMLGLIPSSEMSWDVAVDVMKPSGGWAHVHGNVHDDDLAAWGPSVAARFEALAAAAGKRWAVTCQHLEKVKSYAPHLWHVVADIHCVAT